MNPLLNPLTSTQRLALSLGTADEGYATFDTTLNNVYFWDGSAWITSTGGGGTVTSVGVTSGTGISASVANPTTTPVITITNTAPDQTVVLNNGTGISVTGTYPNFTITNTSPSSGGTVTGVTATSPITSSGGIAPVISTSMATNRLIGRTTAGAGVMEEISVGTGLTLSGGTLNATAQVPGFEMNFLLMGA